MRNILHFGADLDQGADPGISISFLWHCEMGHFFHIFLNFLGIMNLDEKNWTLFGDWYSWVCAIWCRCHAYKQFWNWNKNCVTCCLWMNSADRNHWSGLCCGGSVCLSDEPESAAWVERTRCGCFSDTEPAKRKIMYICPRLSCI